MPDYEKLTVVKLRDELVARGLSKAGLKAALIQRLIEADIQSEKSESPADEPSVRDQDDDSATGVATWVPQAPKKTESNSHLAEGTPPSGDTDEDKVKVADIGDGPTLYKLAESKGEQHQTGQVQKNQYLEERATNSLTESPSYVSIPDGTRSGDLVENLKESAKGPELQVPILAQKQVGEVQAAEDKAEVSTQTSLTGEELLEDSRKRKRRSQSPPPSSVDNTQKKLKANSRRPLVQLPEDTTADSTQQVERLRDNSLQPDPTDAKESDPQDNGHTSSNGANKLTAISRAAPVGQPDAEGSSRQQLHSSALEDLDPTNKRDATPINIKSVDSPVKPSPSDTRFKNLFTAPTNVDHESQQSHYPHAEEKPVSPALHPATSALYIRELMRPLKLESLRDHLIALATPPDTAVNPSIMTDFFLDTIRTHCLVGFDNISAASRVRSGLHDRVWPNERDRRQLWVDFVPEESLKSWIDVERKAGNGRGHPSKRWEVVYEDEQDVIKTSLQEVGSSGGGLRAANRDINQGLQVTGPRISGSESQNTQSKADCGKGFQALDDLFMSTAAKPKLYYLPVLKAEADQRLAKIAAGRGRGRGNEMRRYSFEEGSIVDNGPEFGRVGGYGRGGIYSSSYRGRVKGYRADASRGDSWRERRSGY